MAEFVSSIAGGNPDPPPLAEGSRATTYRTAKRLRDHELETTADAEPIKGDPRDHIVTIAEAAHMGGVTIQQIHWLVKNNRLDGRKCGGIWVLLREEVERWAIIPRKLDRLAGKSD
jgi:hypothetical protein